MKNKKNWYVDVETLTINVNGTITAQDLSHIINKMIEHERTFDDYNDKHTHWNLENNIEKK